MEEVGTYQLSTTMDESDRVFETIIDTRTGKVISRNVYKRDSRKQTFSCY